MVYGFRFIYFAVAEPLVLSSSPFPILHPPLSLSYPPSIPLAISLCLSWYARITSRYTIPRCPALFAFATKAFCSILRKAPPMSILLLCATRIPFAAFRRFGETTDASGRNKIVEPWYTAKIYVTEVWDHCVRRPEG